MVYGASVVGVIIVSVVSVVVGVVGVLIPLVYLFVRLFEFVFVPVFVVCGRTVYCCEDGVVRLILALSWDFKVFGSFRTFFLLILFFFRRAFDKGSHVFLFYR